MPSFCWNRNKKVECFFFILRSDSMVGGALIAVVDRHGQQVLHLLSRCCSSRQGPTKVFCVNWTVLPLVYLCYKRQPAGEPYRMTKAVLVWPVVLVLVVVPRPSDDGPSIVFRGCSVVGCVTSQERAIVSQGRVCSDIFMCCHTEMQVADQTCCVT